jgi:hypothetical protein
LRKEDFLSNTKKKQEEASLTEQEVWDVIEFARALSGGIYGQTYLTPDLISGRMKDITLNPMAATEANLATAMADPKANEAQLQKYSQSFELTSMVYKRLISYLANMLSFDVTYTSNAEINDYTTPKYKKDLAIVEKFLDSFDYRKELRIAVREMLRNDAFFASFYKLENNWILQELPSEYCKITGRWEGGFLFSFNMYWFLQPGVDVNMYPPFFQKKLKDWDKLGKSKYIPSMSPELRGGSSWVYWVDVPVDIGVCFKYTPELATRLPYFMPLFNDLVLQALMRNLQKNMNMAAASKIIVGEVPMLNKDIKATVKDSIAISPALLGKFMALVKSSLSESIKMASAPLQDMKGIDFKGDNELYSKYQRTALASSGVNTNLIFSDEIKPNAVETQLSLNVDEQMMTALYSQFEAFMNYHINKQTKTFRFNLHFEGTDFFLDREARMKKAMELFDKGIVLPQKIASAMGMKPAELRRHMEEAKATGFMDMLTPPTFEQQKELLNLQDKQAEKIADKEAENANKNAENQIKQPEKGVKLNPKIPAVPAEKSEGSGRPRKPISELGEEGMKTRETAANVGRGGKA